MSLLTPRQTEALAFIRHFISVNDMAPTYEEIGTAIKASKGNVFGLVTRLQQRGAITLRPRRARTIQIVDGEYQNVLGPQLTAIVDHIAKEHNTEPRTLIREAVRAYCGDA